MKHLFGALGAQCLSLISSSERQMGFNSCFPRAHYVSPTHVTLLFRLQNTCALVMLSSLHWCHLRGLQFCTRLVMIQSHFTWVFKLFILFGKGGEQGFPLLAVIWGVDFSLPEKDYQSLALPRAQCGEANCCPVGQSLPECSTYNW